MFRSAFAVLGFVALQCVVSVGASAQVGAICTETGGNGMTLLGGCPPWAISGSCQTEGPFLQVWTVVPTEKSIRAHLLMSKFAVVSDSNLN